MSHSIKSPRKLIEVALPLDAINAACAREKSIRHGHPSTLHLWWARRPLAAARAVLFSQLVNDPGYQQGDGFKYGKNKKEAAIERNRLFKMLEELVLWENANNKTLLQAAHVEIVRSWKEVCELNKDHPQASELFNPNVLPEFHDPFAGGGALPLEAQRLGLKANASDLNPVAVLINKAMIEMVPAISGRAPIGPASSQDLKINLGHTWHGAEGFAEDVSRYGQLIRDLAQERIGNFYQPVEITPAMASQREDLKQYVGQKLNVIAWLWARTVKSPNPAYSHVDVPLVSNFILSTKEGSETYVQPVITGDSYRFSVEKQLPPASAKAGTTAGKRAAFICLMSSTPIDYEYIRSEGKAHRIGQRLMAIVLDSKQGRIYVEPTPEIEALAHATEPLWKPEVMLPDNPRDFKTPNYGFTSYADLFSSRQLLALSTFSELIAQLPDRIRQDAINSKMPDDGKGIESGGTGATAYAEAVTVYLALALGKLADYNSTACSWIADRQTMRNTFGRQAIPMVWDFAEANPLGTSTGSYSSALDQGLRVIRDALPATNQGLAVQLDAQTQTLSLNKVVSTDPPYYDNIGYAELSDFFYVWLRNTLRPTLPKLFATISVPKAEELVATPYRHGSKEKAELFFLNGMTQAMHHLAEQAHPAFPITIYYAFKQSDTNVQSDTSSAGWETFLEAVIRAGFAITGTWPMRTEKEGRVMDNNKNALASSIILVCRKRPIEALTVSRREFLRELNKVLPEALDEMTKGSGDDRSPVAPVDLSQAIIGPGMAVFSSYANVLEADGSPMTVRTALQLINRFLAEDDFDRDTQFCLHWLEQHGWSEGSFGVADTLARAKGTSVDGVRDAGVVQAAAGKVRLKRWLEYPNEWDPRSDTRNPIWETLHHLIRALKNNGETDAGRLLSLVRSQAESVRQLAYRLYTLCERQGWAEDARAYNELITSWSGIESASSSAPAEKQLSVFE